MKKQNADTRTGPVQGRAARAPVILAQNRKARHDYHVDETMEAGLVLSGSEVKSIRAGKANLTDAYADISNNEAWLHQLDVSPYGYAHMRNHEPRARRKLLLHRREIERLVGKQQQKGYTIVPLSLYDKSGKIKVELALVRGKQEWDRRQDVKKREAEREIARAMSSRKR